MKNLVKWNITRETGITFLAGILMILLSVAMLPFGGESTLDTVMSVLLRDVLMIFGMGICFVTLYCNKRDNMTWHDMGLKKEKVLLSLCINAVLAIALLFMFLGEKQPENILSLGNCYGATYIMVAGVFEMLFIYGFLRTGFEKSFGIIPAILLTATFYSFHHAGFQPEFIHLFFVGIMYVSVYYITKNLLIIFPFFWGVGALWDVLVDSPSGDSIKNSFSFYVALAILFGIVIWMIFIKKVKER